jgi:hypothetical protein
MDEGRRTLPPIDWMSYKNGSIETDDSLLCQDLRNGTGDHRGRTHQSLQLQLLTPVRGLGFVSIKCRCQVLAAGEALSGSTVALF